MGSRDRRPRARALIGQVLPDVVGEAAGAVVPGAGVGLRAVLAAVDSVRFAEITEEAIVQTVLASIELCDDPLLTRVDDITSSGLVAPGLSLRELARAIGDKTFAPERGEGPAVVYTSAEIARRWADVAPDLERARRTFTAELGGAFLMPKEGAGKLTRMRERLRAAVGHAAACGRAASRLAGQDLSGGLQKYVDRELDALRGGSVELMYALDDVLAAHDELVAAARSIVPERIDELFAVQDPAAAAAAKARGEREAAQELLDNALQALVDAGEELNGWRAHSSLRDVAIVDLRVVAAAADVRFDEGHAANGWLSLGHTIDSARARLEALTSEIAEDLDEQAAAVRTRLLRQLNAANNAAQEISSRYRAVEDARIRGKTEPLDVTGVEERRARFLEASRGACETVDELARLAVVGP